jgi:hypothetical protein
MSSSTTNAVPADAAAADATPADTADAAVADASAAVNVSPLSSSSIDVIEAENPDVSVLNHEEQNQEMKDLLVFDPLGTKQKRKPGTGSTLRKLQQSRRMRKISIQMRCHRGFKKWRNCWRREFAGLVRSAWQTSKLR